MVITVTQETEKQLTALAERVGAPVAVYAGHLLEQRLHENGGRNGSTKFVAQDDDDDIEPNALAKAMAKMLSRTPEELANVRARIFQEMEPPLPLPEGKTLFDMVCGQWPGDETDEEVFEALKRLS